MTAPTPIGAVVAAHAREAPRREWLIAPETGQRVDYGGLAAFCARFARWLDADGVPEGAIVATLLPNGLTASALFVATMAGGRRVAPLSLVAQPGQLAYVVGHCDPAVILTTTGLAPRLRAAVDPSAARRILIVDPDTIDDGPWAASSGTAPRPAPGVTRSGPPAATEPDPDAPALLMYTSGTTGTPKGVDLSHGNLLHAARHVTAWHGLGTTDRVLSALPLYHINGQVIGTLAPLVSGGSLVAPRRFSVSAWWDAALGYDCTWLNMVPTIIAYLLNEAGTAPSVLPGVRFGRSASAPLPPDQHRAFEARFGIPVIEAMGMTESASVVFCNPMSPGGQRIGSPGVPIAVEVRVVDGDGRTLADGQPGEIWLRGPSVMRGYFRDPEQTGKAMTADGWLKSGDLGYRDGDGFYHITGRLKELIIKGGENIAPREIDEALLRHPDILEAAAVGVPHPAYGQDILAAVVTRDGRPLDETALRAFCERELGPYKTPARFLFVAELPKGASGKVQRLKLLDLPTSSSDDV